MTRRAVVYFGLMMFLDGCAAPKPQLKITSFDLSKIQRVSVGQFTGPGGQEVANDFVRDLVGTGLEVTDGHHPGQVQLVGTVTDFKPSNQYIVFLGNTNLMTSNGQSVAVEDPIVSPGTYEVTAEGRALGIPNAQVVSVTALYGVTARLVNPADGSTVWGNNATYEGIDLEAARQGAVGILAQLLKNSLPQAAKKAT